MNLKSVTKTVVEYEYDMNGYVLKSTTTVTYSEESSV
jgi:hypothetical protein